MATTTAASTCRLRQTAQAYVHEFNDHLEALKLQLLTGMTVTQSLCASVEEAGLTAADRAVAELHAAAGRAIQARQMAETFHQQLAKSKTALDAARLRLARANAAPDLLNAELAVARLMAGADAAGSAAYDALDAANGAVGEMQRRVDRLQRRTCSGCLRRALDGAPDFAACAACRAVCYCGHACQAAHWPTHHSMCEVYRAFEV